MNTKKKATFKSPIGLIEITCNSKGLEKIELEPKHPSGETADGTPLLEKAVAQLAEYFAGIRTEFDIPLAPVELSPFVKKALARVKQIPFATTRSYQEIATELGSPRSTRAVGMANHVNPLPIIIPCHRVVGKNGKLTGFAAGVDKKAYLLNHERLSLGSSL